MIWRLNFAMAISSLSTPGGWLKTAVMQLSISNGKYYLKSASSDLFDEISHEDIVGVVSQKAGRRRHQRKRYDL